MTIPNSYDVEAAVRRCQRFRRRILDISQQVMALHLSSAYSCTEMVDTIYPNINDGAEGMYFIQQCVASSGEGGAWLPLRHERARR